MLRHRYINRHEQFGVINYTLILEDLETNPVRVYRIEKVFTDPIELIDASYLEAVANAEIVAINQELRPEAQQADKGEVE